MSRDPAHNFPGPLPIPTRTGKNPGRRGGFSLRAWPVLLGIPLSLLLTLTTLGTGITAFRGGLERDVLRPLPEEAIRLRALEERNGLEGYSLWLQGTDGTTVLISLILSNLARPKESAVHATLYPPMGAHVEAHQEYGAADLRHDARSVSFGRNRLERLSDGSFRLRMAAPLEGTPGELTADLRLTPLTPGFKHGDGRIQYGDGRYFELQLLAPRARARGHVTVAGRVLTLEGTAYLDHTAQNQWPHLVASRWLNYRFFGEGLYVACTSLRTAAADGGSSISHASVFADGGVQLVTSHQGVELLTPTVDAATGYLIPQGLRVRLGTGEPDIALDLPLPTWLHRLDLLEDLNVMLRTLVRTFIARPYTYRFRNAATGTVLHRNGQKTVVPGLAVVEIIYVRE